RLRHQGADYPQTRSTRGLLAGLLERQEQYEEAVLLRRQNWESTRRRLGHNHRYTIWAARDLANAELTRGKTPAAAIEPLAEALRACDQLRHVPLLDRAWLLALLGWALVDSGNPQRLAAAQQRIERCLDLLKQAAPGLPAAREKGPPD